MAETLSPTAEATAPALAQATAELASAGCDSPRLDAELLLAAACGVARERLLLDRERTLHPDEAARFRALLARRAAREPVAYILGRKPFRRLWLTVDRRVLIPRPETELLVEVGLELPRRTRVADVGTGSGAVALALKHERPDLRVTGIDCDPRALQVARANRSRLGLDVRLVQADLLDAGPYDAVLANLPYVAQGAQLAPEIAGYEPPTALFAGPDGLHAIRRLMTRVSEIPVVALEVGCDQAGDAAELLRGAGFESIERLEDLAGHERVIVGRR
ncbi:MAG: peptide chain release factor N(5)-glutamine methyltransferase [Solirubrobacterales bacterium]|nr:peptide chain release factor N(5)-glutamine methyltransferase [Solirubrobacterales bacterium]MBV9471372.1 peptide chain release factor N(5)-glutamine methyltransferase [Solirubrobacterales bacterium]